MNYKRTLDITPILQRKSLFLFGPRQTGKTTYLKNRFPDATYLDLLDIDVLRQLQIHPHHLQDLLKKAGKKNEIVIIDEIQKMPELLDEVHRLIELNKSTRFILTGSSARKLKKAGVNLLGGRASKVHLQPLTLFEISNHDEININNCINYGTLPHILTSTSPKLDLKDYVQLYLQQEIKEEALVRNFIGFSRFLEFAAHCNAEVLNFTSLGNDAQIPSRTIQDYYSILEDTLLGYQLFPFQNTKRKAVSTAKFYFFDRGVCNYLIGNLSHKKTSPEYGKALEHLIFSELNAFKSYQYDKDIHLHFWRTHTQVEVDFILQVEGKTWAIEVKAGANPKTRDLSGIKAFCEEHPGAKGIVVCSASHSYQKDGIDILSIGDFVQALWSKNLSEY